MNHLARFGMVLCAAAFFVPQSAAAQALSVTVTPPLIQLTIGPGELWRSALKIVNTNPYEVTYYATPADFEAEGEDGKGEFIPLLDTPDDASTLGHWVEITSDPIVVPAGTSREVPFTVHIPENAPPGGHYAAVLVGTVPGDEVFEGSGIKVSGLVSSLLFVRIKGDVEEKGRIREFRSEASLYQSPEADFVLRFENIGTTHLRPQGDITLYNMWGKERGKVQLTQKSGFGNVLPGTVRRFAFSWEGERSIFDIGRYSAVVTLAYGDDQKQNTSATAYFWVVPVVPVSITLGSLLSFIILVAWLIRRYIRRALSIERERHGIAAGTPAPRPYSLETFVEPLREGAVDLRSVGKRPAASAPVRPLVVEEPVEPLTVFDFFQKYSLFFFFVAVLVAGAFGIWMYFDSVLVSEREYEITEVSSGEEEITE